MAIAGDFAPFLPYCLLACYVAFLFSRPSRRDAFLVTAAGVALGLAFAYFRWGSTISGLGLAAAVWVVVAPVLGRRTIHPAIVLLPAYPAIASVVVIAIHQGGGPVLDRYLLAADGSFGFQPGFFAAAFLMNHSLIKMLCEVFYFGLPVAFASLLHTASAKPVLYLVLLLGATALPAYSIFPAVGAEAAFHDRFPAHPPSTSAASGGPVVASGGIERNFMPSLHAAWGIALLLGAWPLGRPWRAGIVLYLLPMMWSTLARHYLCDLIVAVPWAFAAWSAIGKRWAVLLGYAAIAAAWLFLIRFGLPVLYVSPWLPWTLAAATVAAPAFFAAPSPGGRSALS